MSKSGIAVYRYVCTVIITAAAMAGTASMAVADTYFTENFDTYSGGAGNTQLYRSLRVALNSSRCCLNEIRRRSRCAHHIDLGKKTSQ